MTVPHYADGPVTVWHGDCIDIMRTLPDASVDAVVTDPPYGLEFMGREWDGADGFRRSLNAADTGRDNVFGRASRTSPEYRAGHLFEEWTETWAREARRVLTPGGYLVAFGGTRTWHRLAAGIEDAGFAIRDSLAWMHGQGFPKSDASLKPAFEPVVLARNPGAARDLNIDACRIAASDPEAYAAKGASVVGLDSNRNGAAYGEWTGKRTDSTSQLGRWPANVVLDESQAAALDRQVPNASVNAPAVWKTDGPGSNLYGDGIGSRTAGTVRGGYSDTGGASRFFYTAKAGTDERPTVDGIAHPTVKPLDLMRWLVRLVKPKGGTVLEPFAGSGTTVEAAVLEGFDCIAIEREAAYLPLILKRIRKPHHIGFDLGDWEDAS